MKKSFTSALSLISVLLLHSLVLFNDVVAFDARDAFHRLVQTMLTIRGEVGSYI